jgi:hypothetical protein
MRKIIFIILVLAIIIFSAYRNNSNPKVIITDLLDTKNGITAGDLKYEIYFLNIFPIGTATLFQPQSEEYQGKKIYHLRAVSKTLKVFSKLFNATAVLDSYVDAETHNPLTFKQSLQINNKPNVTKEVFYDQKNGLMTIAGVARTILPNTQDPLSAVLNLKKMDLEKIRDFEMNINTNQKNYVLNGTVIPKDLSINNKTYKIYILKAVIKRRDKNNPYHRSKITMIMLKDSENIPVSIKVFASGVLINARLAEIE